MGLSVIITIVLVVAVFCWVTGYRLPIRWSAPSGRAPSGGRVTRATRQQLLRLTGGNLSVAERLVGRVRSQHPERSEQWWWEKAIYDKARRNLRKAADADPYALAWQSDSLVFDATPLDRVVLALQRKFHRPIALRNPQLVRCKLTTDLTGLDLEAILRILAATLQLEVQREGEKVWLDGNPDNC